MARTSTTAGKGNTLAVTHGAKSPRIVAERTEAIVAEWTDPENKLPALTAADTAAVYATAAAYARFAEICEYLERPGSDGKPIGALDARGRPRGAMRVFYTAYRETMSGLRQLGATPAGRAEMGLTAARNRSALAQLAQARREP